MKTMVRSLHIATFCKISLVSTCPAVPGHWTGPPALLPFMRWIAGSVRETAGRQRPWIMAGDGGRQAAGGHRLKCPEEWLWSTLFHALKQQLHCIGIAQNLPILYAVTNDRPLIRMIPVASKRADGGWAKRHQRWCL